jgi:C4-dicarboxylate transporter/malic acid transport protein
METMLAAPEIARPRGPIGLERVGPGWYTPVMGTGILAICATISPVPIPFGQTIGAALWSADLFGFVLVSAMWLLSIVRAPRAMAATLHDPVKAQLWGAPPMACFTIAVGFLRIGEHLGPQHLCIGAAQALFAVGVLGSIFSMSVVPFLMFTRHELSPEKTVGSWLLPVVPPIVASVPAALLSPTWPVALRGDMLAIGFALLGSGIALAAIIIVAFYSRMLYHKVPGGTLVTTTWLVIGPLGQSIGGFILLGGAAQTVWPEYGHGLSMVALAYGVLVWGFAMYWLAMALAMTLRAVRLELPFDLSWWAFTFPVGVLTVGTDALFTQTHAAIFAVASVGLIALLACAWATVATKTIAGARRATSQTQGRADEIASGIRAVA